MNEKETKSEIIRKSVWAKFYNTKRCVRYFESLAGYYKIASNFLRFILLLPLFSGIALFLDVLPNNIQLALGVVIAVLVTFEMVFNISKNAMVLHSISVECSKLEDKWHQLWIKTYSDGSDYNCIMTDFVVLSESLTDITCKADDAIVYKFNCLNKKCGRLAHKDLMETFHDRQEKS